MPASTDFPYLIESFLAAMNAIGRYGHEKYGVHSFQHRRESGDYGRGPLERTQTPAILTHATAHLIAYGAGVPHDHFGTHGHQLAASAFNAMMEWYFASGGDPLTNVLPIGLQVPESDGWPVPHIEQQLRITEVPSAIPRATVKVPMPAGVIPPRAALRWIPVIERKPKTIYPLVGWITDRPGCALYMMETVDERLSGRWDRVCYFPDLDEWRIDGEDEKDDRGVVIVSHWFDPMDLMPTPCEHKWETRRMGGPPDMAESNERVTVCRMCGAEKGGE